MGQETLGQSLPFPELPQPSHLADSPGLPGPDPRHSRYFLVLHVGPLFPPRAEGVTSFVTSHLWSTHRGPGTSLALTPLHRGFSQASQQP